MNSRFAVVALLVVCVSCSLIPYAPVSESLKQTMYSPVMYLRSAVGDEDLQSNSLLCVLCSVWIL